MLISPVNRQWVHQYVVEPYLQGCDLMNRGWTGIDLGLAPKRLFFKERLVSWAQGVSLLLPFVNTIIWLAWQAFGHPKKKFDDYCPEPAVPARPPHDVAPPVPEIPAIAIPIQRGPTKPPESFGYTEKVGSSITETDWHIECFPDRTLARQTDADCESHAVYTQDWSLQRYHYRTKDKTCEILKDEERGDRVHLRFQHEKGDPIQRTLTLEAPLPWIQQRAVGLQPFILSEQSELHFCSVIPEIPIHIPWLEKPPFVMKSRAKKIGLEEVDGHGELLKIEVMSARGFPYNTVKSEMWFDPKTARLKKFVDSGTFISRKEGELRTDP